MRIGKKVSKWQPFCFLTSRPKNAKWKPQLRFQSSDMKMMIFDKPHQFKACFGIKSVKINMFYQKIPKNIGFSTKLG